MHIIFPAERFDRFPSSSTAKRRENSKFLPLQVCAAPKKRPKNVCKFIQLQKGMKEIMKQTPYFDVDEAKADTLKHKTNTAGEVPYICARV